MLIYKATNKTNNKAYIGQTTTSLGKRITAHMLEARKGKRSKSAFHSALLKYGLDNFSIETIERCDTIDDLNERETYSRTNRSAAFTLSGSSSSPPKPLYFFSPSSR